MKIGRIALILCFGAVCASAQLGGLLKKVSGSKTGTDATAVLAQGQDLLAYVTLATDNGIEAVGTLTNVFPPEKVQKIKDLAVKYNELKAKRGDQNIDAESIQVASEIAAETAKLDSEWQTYLKEKSSVVKKADARLALVVLADALAGTKAPETAKALQSAAQDLKSDPTQVSKMNRLLSIATMLATVGKEAPQQVNSFTTVRGITKRIAEAEKIQLAPNPSPDSVKDKTSFASTSNAITE